MSTNQKIYLDNNASTPIDPRVLEIVVQSLKEIFGNPSSLHHFGQTARSRLNKARQAIASVIGVKSQEIIFTSGGSEGANFVIKGLLPPMKAGHIITSNIEHACVYETLKFLQMQGYHVTFLSPEKDGTISTEAVRQALTPQTKLISLMAVNNETGVQTDIQAIGTLAKDRNVPFVVDGVALLGKEFFRVPEGVSAMFFSGHKIHAPKGIGFVFVRSKLQISPLISGGEQEFGRRAGSENLSGIMGLAEAIRLIQEEGLESIQRVQQLRDYFEQTLIESITDIKINGVGPRVCNISNICFRGVEGETLLTALDLAGIAASHGSACASGAIEPSRVLLNMGLTPVEAASSLRFSLSRYNSKEEINHCIQILISLVNKLRYTHPDCEDRF